MYYLSSCNKCQGDLVASGDEVRCFQCGAYYYPRPTVADESALLEGPEVIPTPRPALRPHKRTRRSKWAGSEINGGIRSREHRENLWWSRHRQVVVYLREGRTVSQIAALTGQNPRQIRHIREQARDLELEQVKA